MMLLMYYARLLTIKYYTVQVTNLYTDASDSQDNHTEVYNIIQMQMTPKKDIKAEAFNLFHKQCPLCASY